jgi:large conductance mechanosensitive channel
MYASAASRAGARLIRVSRERGAMTGFKNFVMRGNLVELAVAVVIGTQFSSLVKQFVSSFIDPLLSLVGGTPDLGKLVLHVGKVTFTYGQFLTEALTFLISALVVYYAMVLPVSRLLKLLDRNEAATSRDCPECTMSIPVAARRCPECTAEIAPATEQPRQLV